MLAFLSIVWACDPTAVEALATGLTAEDTPKSLGPRIAAACPRPLGLNRALKDPTPEKDVQAAVGQASRWVEVCQGGLDAIPDGFGPVTSGERMALWSQCDLARFEAFEANEWIASTGPAISTILLADQLKRSRIPAETRVPLIRAYAGLAPVETPEERTDVVVLGEVDPLAGFRDVVPPSAVTLASVTWPPRVDPEAVCLIEVDIVADGVPGRVEWVTCPEELRPYVESALEASWFQPGRKNGKAVKGSIRLRYTPEAKRPEITPPA